MSEVINKNKYLDFSGLSRYDELIKGFIASGDNALAAAIADLDAKIGNLDIEGSDDKNLSEIVDDIYASIADIIEYQNSLDIKDADLAEQIKKVADDLDFITGGSSDNEVTLVEIKETLSNIQTELSEVKETADKAIVDSAQAKEDAAQAVVVAGQAQTESTAAAADAAQAKEDAAAATAVATQAQADATKAKEDAAAATADAADAKSAVETLIGEGEGSVKKIAEDAAAEAVAAVVAGADSDFDTLKEVADWIAADKEGSAALQVTVSEHTEIINVINSDLDTLEAKVDEDIANLTTHMTEAASALAEVDGRLDVLESFEETHDSIAVVDIENLFTES